MKLLTPEQLADVRMTDERMAEVQDFADKGFPSFEYSDRMPYWIEVWNALVAERQYITTLEAEKAELVKYVKHKVECVEWEADANNTAAAWLCGCGLDELLKQELES